MNHVYHRFWYRVSIVVALTLIPLAGPVAVHTLGTAILLGGLPMQQSLGSVG
jgi:multisubunit Na+/H+ antiporter MnhG subunit